MQRSSDDITATSKEKSESQKQVRRKSSLKKKNDNQSYNSNTGLAWKFDGKLNASDFQSIENSGQLKSADGLKDEFIDSREKDAIEKLSLAKWRQHFSKSQSIVSDVLMGQYLSKLECTVCKNASYNFEPFYMIELSLPPGKDETTLAELLTHSTKEDVLDGFLYDCPKCLTTRPVTKSSHIYKLPPVLVICYKRFEFRAGKLQKNACLVNMNISGEDLSMFELGKLKPSAKYYAPYMIIVSVSIK